MPVTISTQYSLNQILVIMTSNYAIHTELDLTTVKLSYNSSLDF